jgi:hypothetical protein
MNSWNLFTLQKANPKILLVHCCNRKHKNFDCFAKKPHFCILSSFMH